MDAEAKMSGEKAENGKEETPNSKIEETHEDDEIYKVRCSSCTRLILLMQFQIAPKESIKTVSRTNSASIDANVQFKSVSSSRPNSGKVSKPAPSQNVASGVPNRTSSTSNISTSSPRPPPKSELSKTGDASKLTGDVDREAQTASMAAASHDQGTSWYDPRRVIKPDYEGTIKELKRRLNETSKDAQAWKSQAVTYNKEAQTWKREFELARSEMNQMADQQEQQAEKFRRVQERAFRQIDSAEWMPESNEDISRKLKGLDFDIKAWAKTYAVPLVSKIETTRDERAKLMDCLNCVVRLENDKVPSRVGDDRAWMLLQARLLHKLYTEIFEEPFFFIGERLCNVKPAKNDDARSANIDAAFSTLYDELREVDEKDAFAWRAQTLRLLAPPSNSSRKAPKAVADTNKRTEEARDNAAVVVCDEFLQTGIEPLMASPRCDAAEKLLHSFAKRAAQISFSLWVQKRDLEYRFKEELPKVFKHDHSLLEAHQLHNKHLNDNPARLDGLPILVVTHPAVVSRGNDDGDYEVRSVLKKAICWMGEPPGWKH
ncbi:uncharacterized protein BDZ99DRAFT_265717 [Mytilinidion resinicola]|uniref:Uncharacterized protein n=1 Tax=Mytilinidion resinicola TaxID=574789 RepID=A0A6A6YTU6_9PEZI|nr:uncharacterized protein BDZ99DRAFT_265717 [Mytilinidion resinicola]KAF2812376.1 hypothetical protein BDZ99DRAFT_265717 [Mytilinidion resinicola]